MMRRRDHEAERLLRGGTDPHFDAFAEALRTPSDIDPTVATAHVAVAAYIAAAATLAGDTPTVDRAPAVSRRRRIVVRGAGLGLTAKLLLGGAVAVAGTGGAAAGGILPEPIQSVIADTVAHVGISLPNPRLLVAATTTPPDMPSTTKDDPSANAPAVPGTYWWNGIACDGAPFSTVYRVTMDGDLELVAADGNTGRTDATADLIRVAFAGVAVDIRIVGDALTVDEDRSCDTGDGADPDEVKTAAGKGPGHATGRGPGENNGSPPGENSGNGNGPGWSNGNGSAPGDNSGNGNGPGANNGSPPGENSGNGKGPGQNNGKGPGANQDD